MFKTKSEAVECARQAFERWQNRNEESTEETPKADISLDACLDMFLNHSLARAENVDEKFGFDSHSNNVNAVGAIKKVVVDNTHAKKMMLAQLTKARIEAMWAEMRKGVSYRTCARRPLPALAVSVEAGRQTRLFKIQSL